MNKKEKMITLTRMSEKEGCSFYSLLSSIINVPPGPKFARILTIMHTVALALYNKMYVYQALFSNFDNHHQVRYGGTLSLWEIC